MFYQIVKIETPLSPELMMWLAYFFIQCSETALATLWHKKFSEIFFRCRVISNNNLEIHWAFWRCLSPLSKLRPHFSRINDGAGLFFHTMFWNSLGYLMTKKFSENFFHCRVISKNNLEINDFSASFCQIFHFEGLFLRIYWCHWYILFMYNFLQGARLSFGYNNVFKIFFRCIVISKKNIFEKNWTFCYILSNCQNWDLMSPEILMWLAYFSHTMFWSRLTYLMPKPKFFRCRFISKNKLEIIELFAIFIKLSKLRPHFSRINDWPAYFFIECS